MSKFLALLLMLLVFYIIGSYMQVEAQSKDELQRQIDKYEAQLSILHEQKNTLSSQVQFFDTQIYLANLRIQDTEQKIKKTEEEISSLGGRITGLNNSLDRVSKLLIKKIAEDYKHRDIPLISLFVDSEDASALINRMKYAKSAQQSDQKLALQVQQAKQNFQDQKDLREAKKIDLDKLINILNSQKETLDTQKKQKQRLLADTQNDEATYQRLLQKAKSEYAAIQTIITTGSNEVSLGQVKKGDKIAGIIQGPSCNSGGAHLHFIVKQNGGVVNPFSYLSSIQSNNCSGSSCGSSDGDPFNPSGSWEWPLLPPITMQQGYGSTWAIRNTWLGRLYTMHNGIDINGSSFDVRAVADGELFRGGFAGNGCTLPYVKLVHKEGTTQTYYLHVSST